MTLHDGNPFPPPKKNLLERPETIDEGQITHLICARLKYDLYDFLGGVLGPFLQEKNRKQAQNTP